MKKTRPRRPQTNGKVERLHRILLVAISPDGSALIGGQVGVKGHVVPTVGKDGCIALNTLTHEACAGGDALRALVLCGVLE